MSTPYIGVVSWILYLRNSVGFSGRIGLVKADEAWSQLKPGDRGIISTVDDDGTVHIECNASTKTEARTSPGPFVIEVYSTGHEIEVVLHGPFDDYDVALR